jgi:UvrD-like helicase C-terminal domain
MQISTIHKVKGAESDTVVFFVPKTAKNKCPSIQWRPDDDGGEERRFAFVAVSRAMRVEGTRGVVLEQGGHEIAGQTFITGTTNADSGRGKCLKFFQGCLNGPFMRLKDCIAFWP